MPPRVAQSLSIAALSILSLTGAALMPSPCHAATPRDLRDVVGVSHIHGQYNFTDEDFVNEGADKLLELGTRVIKVAFRDQLEGYYPFNCQWPELHTLVEVAQTPYFRKLFAKPFSTYVLMAFAPGMEIHYFTQGMSPEDVTRERQMFRDLTVYLLTEYRGTGNTFVLQNWESDWVLTPPSPTTGMPSAEPTPTAVQGMIEWFNARQEGVEAGRREVTPDGVMVAHAPEVNLVVRAMEGMSTATNDVIPHTRCDLYSYSSWDSSLSAPDKFRPALAYLASKAPPSALFGDRNVFVGEYGGAEHQVGGPDKQLDLIRRATETALDWGARYVIYWQLYCDGPARKFEGRPANDDCWGLWLIRPDGSKAPLWDYFHGLLAAQPTGDKPSTPARY